MHRPTCPSCKATITHLLGENNKLSYEFMATQFPVLLTLCPECKAILSAQIDPIAVDSDLREFIRQEVARQLAARR